MKPLLLGTLLAVVAAAETAPLSGLWDATVKVNDVEIPFRIEIASAGQAASGAFFNGEERVPSTGGTFDGATLLLRFDHYATKLEAKLENGVLTGTYGRPSRQYVFQAKRFVPSPLTKEDVPAIAGNWVIPTKSSKGENAWRLIVRQSGAEVTAAILRVDGDTGALSGTFRDGRFLLSHFSGARPSLLEVKALPDGTLEIVQNGKTKLTALRATEAVAKGLPEPADPSRHTGVKDPTEVFRFSGKDLQGNVVNETDARFQGKVVIVAVGGTWCPNCHDEAPFLVELDRKYRARGLQVVSLSFEEAEQLANPTRVRAFIQQYGISYPVLLGGEQAEVHSVLPQAVNLNTWPASFILGRDGRVRATHAGFAGKATGELHERLKAEITHTVEKLLAETVQSKR